MPRLFDHLVLAVSDLKQAHATYQALGFTLTPRAVHPFGTCNHLVQFAAQNFLELVAVGDDNAIPAHEPPQRFSFAAYNRQFTQDHGQRFSMLCFRGSDARADVAEFRAKGMTTYEAFDFGRDARLPDGSVARVGFSLAFATDDALPDSVFFTCQHQHPADLFWKADYQAHANGALGVVEVIISADPPTTHQAFFERLMATTAAGDEHVVTVGPVTQQLTVMSQTRLLQRFPEFAGQSAVGTPLKAYRISTGDLSITRACLERNHVPFRVTIDSLVIPPNATHGVLIEFTAL